ncbi:kinase domain protein [Penicillium capsulatum]|nr:kinase domain protein [Penicillium capsulatum]
MWQGQMQPLFVNRLRLMNYVMRRGFSFCTKPAQLLSNPSATPISQHELVDEETGPAYDPRSYYPAKPGEILANHYQLLVKIGWGTRSTVWLARDITRHVLPVEPNSPVTHTSLRPFRYRWQTDRSVTLKILNNNRPEDARDERAIEEQIAQKGSSHRGSAIIRTCLDSLEVNGPEGNHLCLVYEPMREPLWIFQGRFPSVKLPLSIAKAYICILLTGLDYLHTECRVVHTDLKLENILMTFENEHILPDFIKHQTEKLPMQYKPDAITGRTVYRCHNDFGPLDRKSLKHMVPKIADFGLATKLNNEVGIHIIQPDHYRAPEVILGCGWDFSADIWNFGVMVWNIIENTELFRQVHDDRGRYDSKAHLAEMIALLGPPLPSSCLQSRLPWNITNGLIL